MRIRRLGVPVTLACAASLIPAAGGTVAGALAASAPRPARWVRRGTR